MSTSHNRTYRDRVLKIITDRPGDVVYREDIHEKLPELTLGQISSTIARLKADPRTVIGKDIEVVIPANAWRYVPNARVRSATRMSKKTGELTEGKRKHGASLTGSIRAYFKANPNRPIFIEELREMMSTEDAPLEHEKVRVGVANARQHDREFRDHLIIVVAGNAWQYVPNDETTDRPKTVVDLIEKSAAATSESSTPIASSVPQAATSAPAQSSGDNLMMLEKIGALLDGSSIVRDVTDSALYRLTPMN